MPRVLKSTYRELWYLSACKKSTPSLTSLLRYCKEIANLLFWDLWECLTIPIKTIVSIRGKFSCLSAYKKSASSLTPSFKYCKEITNLLFLITWACLDTHTYNNSTNLKKTYVYLVAKINFILHVSFEILQRYCKLVVLGTLSIPGYAQPKYQLLCLSAGKKSTSFPMLFWRYLKDMHTSQKSCNLIGWQHFGP